MNPIFNPGFRPALWAAVGILVATGGRPVSATESAYAPTPVGTIEVKQLPAATVMSAGAGPQASRQNGAFMTLFRYIETNKVAMTVPVETDASAGRMRFYAGRKAAERGLASTDAVAVEAVPARTVVSVGLRGSYTRERYEDGVRRLETWLATHKEWRRAGEPYGVYWNSPFMPGFLKRSEVHLTVVPAATPVTPRP